MNNKLEDSTAVKLMKIMASSDREEIILEKLRKSSVDRSQKIGR